MLKKPCGCPKVQDPKMLERVLTHLEEIMVIAQDPASHQKKHEKFFQAKMNAWFEKTKRILSEV